MYAHGFKDYSFNSTTGSGEPEDRYVMRKIHEHLNLRQDFTKISIDQLAFVITELTQELYHLLNDKRDDVKEMSSFHKRLLLNEYHVKVLNEVHEICTIGNQKWIPELDYWILALESVKRKDGNFYYYYLNNSVYNKVHSLFKDSNSLLDMSGDSIEVLIDSGLAVQNGNKLEYTQKYNKMFPRRKQESGVRPQEPDDQ